MATPAAQPPSGEWPGAERTSTSPARHRQRCRPSTKAYRSAVPDRIRRSRSVMCLVGATCRSSGSARPLRAGQAQVTMAGPALTARHWRGTVNGGGDAGSRRPHLPAAQAYVRSWAARTRRMSRTGTAGRRDHTAATAGQAARLTGVRAAAASAKPWWPSSRCLTRQSRPRQPAPAGYLRNPLGQAATCPAGAGSADPRIHANQPLTEQGQVE